MLTFFRLHESVNGEYFDPHNYAKAWISSVLGITLVNVAISCIQDLKQVTMCEDSSNFALKISKISKNVSRHGVDKIVV